MRSTPLPPSMEKAYHTKCIELRRRLNEIEDANEAARLRKHRVGRSILKMRLERAFFLDKLARLQQVNSIEDSDRSPSPALNDRIQRPRRTYTLRSPPMLEQQTSFPSHLVQGGENMQPILARHSTQRRAQPHLASPNPIVQSAQRSMLRSDAIDKRAPSEVPPHESLPLIYKLPNGTNVLILDTGMPKQAPWTMHDIEPRHHLVPDFESYSKAEQERILEERKYEPFDLRGQPVNVRLDRGAGKYKHVFKGEQGWKDPEETIDTPNGDRRHDIGDTHGHRDGVSSRREAITLPSQLHSHEAEAMNQNNHAADAGQGGFTAVNR